MQNYTFNIWLYFKYKNQGDYLRMVDELGKSQWFTTDILEKYKLDKLKEICTYAYNHIPYYTKLFKNIGLLNTNDIKSIEDIKRIPILTKDKIRTSLQEISDTNRKDNLIYQTGGSTGIPLQFYGNKEYLYKHKWASNMRAYSHGGYKFGNKLAVVWGFDNDLQKRTFKAQLVNRLTYNYTEINSFKFTQETLMNFVQELNKKKIPYIKGYASSLFEVADFMLRNNLKLNYPVKSVFSEAERLDDFKRARIEEAFKCMVYNYYGSREFGTIAVECSQHNGLHINYEQLFVELDTNNDIIVTSYFNLGTPFIRYRIGDCADRIITEPCSCGRYSERINKIFGRESDNFISSNGKVIHGEYITHLFYNVKHISQFQVIQEAPEVLSFKIVSTNESMAKEELNSIISKLENHFEGTLRVNISFVNEIDKTRTGKFKFTIRNF